MKTGEWIHLENETATLDKQQPLLNQTNLSFRQRAASSCEVLKNGLSGTQLVKLSLLPNKEKEIIDEVQQNIMKRSSLSKRYSMIKKAKSQSLSSPTRIDEEVANIDERLNPLRISKNNNDNAATPTTAMISASIMLPASIQNQNRSSTSNQKPRNIFFANEIKSSNANAIDTSVHTRLLIEGDVLLLLLLKQQFGILRVCLPICATHNFGFH